MALRTGKLILARGIKLDKSYKNTTDYSESSMVSLVTSKAVASSSNCSFLRQGENVIEIEVPYGTALQANYIAFQNPDYSNKWFFGFIDEVEYVSNKNSRIHFTIDELSTWFDYWNAKPCLVVREHVNDDTIGLHTIPEGLEYGDYRINRTQHFSMVGDNPESETEPWYVCFVASKPPEPNNPVPIVPTVGYDIGSSFSPLIYFAVKSSNAFSDARKIIEWYNSQGSTTIDAVKNMYMIPASCVDRNVSQSWTKDGQTVTCYAVKSSTIWTNSTFCVQDTVMDGLFTPHNNKLHVFPYSYLYLSNKNGSDVVYKWEDGGVTNDEYKIPIYSFRTAIVPSASISAKLYPITYKGKTESSSYYSSWNYGISFGKIPLCAWTSDYYTNWLTQNGVNIASNIGMSLVGALTGNVSGLVNSVVGSLSQMYQASVTPDQAKGDVNTGDVTYSYTFNNITAYHMTIRREYAEVIDRFFDLHGYKVNSVKIPNQTGRTYWNFVQIAEGESIGYSKDNTISVPSASMDIINNAYQRGVTIWHNHDNIGNYNLNNTIV